MLRLILALLATVSLFAANQNLGKPLTLKQPSTVAEVNANADSLVGKTVQVKGKVTEVCQMMGCWMALADADSEKIIRIKVKDGDIVFPKEAVGKMAIAEGKLSKNSLTKEQALAQAKHEAEEQGKTFKPESVKGPVVSYQIQGTGAVILD